MAASDYILLSDSEKERLQLQARVWQAETERLLDTIGVQAGWECLDLGCGAMGILGPLSRRVAENGRVSGLEMDGKLLAAAQQYVVDEGLTNVALKQGDAYQSGFSSESFNLVHERFVMPHVVDPAALLQEIIRMTKPNGIVIIQEPDHSSWNFWPYSEKWSQLLPILESALALRGDINIGRQTFQLARQAGYAAVCSAYGGYNFPGDDAFHLQRFHGDPQTVRLKNWLMIDPRKCRAPRYEYGDCSFVSANRTTAGLDRDGQRRGHRTDNVFHC